ncbi:hypothetical protein AMEX_G12291 [Astyanax mexicanus]|uniref:Protein zwilch n=1 Tax=Astyanax mexicanus TaxID=7994 RepID=A0A8T2LM27_ASTMX|nr:hypothetical protein AMEX_G12291 [Astyanax mexicanus]
MRDTIISEANSFIRFLKSCQDDSKDFWTYQDNIRILKQSNQPILSIIEGNQVVFICEETPPKHEEEVAVNTEENSLNEEVSVKLEPFDIGPLPLTIHRARQLLSWYTMSQNPNMPQVEAHVLPPLWVRCDMSDPAGVSWLGAETVYAGSKATAVKLYTVCCKGATTDESSFMTMEQLKQEHQNRHSSSAVGTKGWAEYNLFCSVKEESLVIDSQSSVTAFFRWVNVDKVLETPPLSSTVTLHIKVTVGDIRSPLYQTYRELEFLLTLADGLRTGEIEWLEPLETQSAVELTRMLIEDLDKVANAVPGQNLKGSENQKAKTDSVLGYGTMLMERGDLDFTEQLWERMRKSVTSYQDITDSLKLVIKAVRFGQIKPWVHRASSSSLSKLIVQSYQQQVDTVPLTGLTPAIMLLELGLDKMRKDYINYLVGKELTTLNHLSYYLSSDVDLQEQVIRLKKLHHLLEILGTCSSFLNLPHERLFFFTQSVTCSFVLLLLFIISTTLLLVFCSPLLLGHVCSTTKQHHTMKTMCLRCSSNLLSSATSTKRSSQCLGVWRCPVDRAHERSRPPFISAINLWWITSHLTQVKPYTLLYRSPKRSSNLFFIFIYLNFYFSDLPLEVTVSAENEKAAYFRTMVCCSLANFT